MGRLAVRETITGEEELPKEGLGDGREGEVL